MNRNDFFIFLLMLSSTFGLGSGIAFYDFYGSVPTLIFLLYIAGIVIYHDFFEEYDIVLTKRF